jgi:hypothetical protein
LQHPIPASIAGQISNVVITNLKSWLKLTDDLEIRTREKAPFPEKVHLCLLLVMYPTALGLFLSNQYQISNAMS